MAVGYVIFDSHQWRNKKPSYKKDEDPHDVQLTQRPQPVATTTTASRVASTVVEFDEVVERDDGIMAI